MPLEDCFINGNSHALSSRIPPPVVDGDFFFAPLSLSMSSSTKSTTLKNNSTPTPRTTVDTAYSTAVRDVLSFSISPCRRSKDDINVFIHDCNFPFKTEESSSPPLVAPSLFSNRQLANVATNVAYPPDSIDPHAARYLICNACCKMGMHCGNISSEIRCSCCLDPVFVSSSLLFKCDVTIGKVRDTKRLNSEAQVSPLLAPPPPAASAAVGDSHR